MLQLFKRCQDYVIKKCEKRILYRLCFFDVCAIIMYHERYFRERRT